MAPAPSSLHPLVSVRKLEQLLGRSRQDIVRLASVAGRYYNSYDIRFAGTAKWRHIDNPRGEVKHLQKRIQHNILRTAQMPATMMGGVRKRSIKDNLAHHKAPEYLLTLDLRDCFPRINHRAVFGVYSEVFGCSSKIASILTRLTTYQERLPQGAPTSTYLANLSLVPLHDDLQALADEFSLRLSFWIDDIALSGQRAREAIEPAIQLIMHHGHAVRRKKIRRMPSGFRQELTGGVTNRKVSAGRSRIEATRERILLLGRAESPTSYELASILGTINQISSLCSTQGDSLKRFALKNSPTRVVDAEKPRKFETRTCNRASRHRTPRNRVLFQKPPVMVSA